MTLHKTIAARLSALLLFGLAACAALDAGGVPIRAQAGLSALSAFALALVLLGDTRRRAPRLPLVLAAPLLVFAIAALQCLPIPAVLLSLIAPVNALLRFFPPAPLSSFAPLTLDLPATAAALAPAFALVTAFAAAVLAARSKRAQLLLLVAPIAGALAQLGIAFIRFAGTGVFAGTFVNRNHLAALLVLGALSSMGAALSPPRDDEPGELPSFVTLRAPWIAGAAACAAGALLTLSRGAVVSLGVGIVTLAWLAQRAQSRKPDDARAARRSRWRLIWLALPLSTALVAALLLSTNPLTSRFQQLSEAGISSELKLRSFIGAAEVALDHPLFGVGRGAWRFAAERHRSVPGDMAFIFVENEPLQLAVEEGLPVALFVLVLTIIGWLRAARAARTGLTRGVLAGALAVALQNLVDFNLSFLGVGLPFAIALGAAMADERTNAKQLAARAPGSNPPPANSSDSRTQASVSSALPGWRSAPRSVLAFAALLGLLIAPLPLLLARWSAEAEGARLMFEARDAKTSSEMLLADAADTIVRHPADWQVALAPAVGLHQRAQRRTAEALAWAGRAQMLGPRAWRPHVVTSAILLRAGHLSQARVETRLALEATPGRAYGEPTELAIAMAQTLDDLLDATPDDPQQRAQVSYFLRLHHRAALARELVDHELALPQSERSEAANTSLLTELAILREADRDFAGVESVVLRLPEESCERALLLSRARQNLDRSTEEIEQPLLDARVHCPLQQQLFEILVHGRIARHDFAGAQALLDDPALRESKLPFASDVPLWRAELLEAQGQSAQALHERWLSALLAPENPYRALDYVQRLQSANDLPGALAALRTLSLRAPLEARPPLDAKIAEIEKLRETQRRPPGTLP